MMFLTALIFIGLGFYYEPMLTTCCALACLVWVALSMWAKESKDAAQKGKVAEGHQRQHPHGTSSGKAA